MAIFNEQVIVDRSGDWSSPNPSIGGESLIVKHSENGRSPGVTFINDGGGYFVQQFSFAADANLPGNEAATLCSDWHGLTVTGQRGMVFSVGPLSNAPGIAEGSFTFINADVSVLSSLRVSGNTTVQGYGAINGNMTVGGDNSVFGNASVGGDAAFNGNATIAKSLTVAGDITLSNADCAEEFELVPQSEAGPGMVVTLTDDGRVTLADTPYDTHVVGVVSGAGSYRPALVLDHQDSPATRVPVGLLGKVYCWADANHGEIRAGDLLTTSSTRGCAMRASDSSKAFGATIGKALGGLKTGQGLIPVLINLR